MTVVTRAAFAACPAHVWDALVFYEQIDVRPPLLLRFLLPIPIRTEPAKSSVGDEVRCLYEGGHLVKRIARMDRERLYAFDVVEQRLAVGGGLRLHGGWYGLRGLPDGGTEVEVGTRYASPMRPRWIFRLVEAAMCHRFHRHILAALGRRVQSDASRPER